MSMKRFLSIVMSLCLLITVLAPAASAVGTKASVRENILFNLLDKNLFDIDLFGNKLDTSLKVEQIEDDEVVKILIIMDDLSVIETDSKAVYNESTQTMMDGLAAGQAEVVGAIEQTVLEGESLQVNYSYTWLLNGIATQVPYALISRIEQVEGVKQVLLQPRYEVCQSQVTQVSGAQTMTISDGTMIGRESAWADGYTGQGMKIAVIDTGLDVDHQNFQALPEDKLTEDSADAQTIAAVLEQLNAVSRMADLAAEDLYINTKVVYGFNYADNNLDITHDNDSMGDHGTHVAGIAAANKVDQSEVVGVAPDAQLLVMKVYGADHGGYGEDILAALEDALLLGSDVINMSLGTNAGFTSSTDEVNAIYNRVAETNTVLCISAGNNYSAGYRNMWGSDANQTKYPDNAVVGEPGIYNNVLSVASVENWYIQRNYIAAGDAKLAFVETSSSYGLPSVLTLEGSYDLVLVPGYGAAEDFEGLDVEGKIAIVQRGTESFVTKCENAAAAGAVACIVYNNTSGEFGMDLTDCTATIPCVSVTMEDGEFLIAALEENPQLQIAFPEETAPLPSLTAYEMSDFSSCGVAPDLSLEPDITAPGGNVYSTINDGQYGLMSGTSMSAPNLAGMAALVMQYVKENHPDADISIREMVQNLLVSTASPLTYDEEGKLYYAPRKQGSGLANAFYAVRTQAYLSTEGCDSPKAELGDDAEKTGVYQFSFDVTNFGTSTLYYRLRTAVQTEDYMTMEEYADVYFMSGTPRALDAATAASSENMVLTHDLSGDGTADSHDAYLVYLQAQEDSLVDITTTAGDELFRYDTDGDAAVTMDDVQAYLDALVGLESQADLTDSVLQVEAGQSVSVSVSIELGDADREYLDTYYPNGGYVEGFTFLSAINSGSVELSLPFLGFYGSWDDAPILDDGFYWDYLDTDEVVEEEEQPEEGEEDPGEGEEDSGEGEEDSGEGEEDPGEGEEDPGEGEEDPGEGEEDPGEGEEDFDDEELKDDAMENTVVGNQYINVLWTEFYGADSSFYPGYNAYVSEEFDPEHISISPNGDGYIDTIDEIYVSLLRNARYLTFRYVDRDTGEVYYDQTVEYVSKSAYSSGYDQIIPSIYSWFEGEILLYDFTDSEGKTLANNTHLMLQVEAIGDYEGATADMWEVPVTVDLEAPQLQSVVKTTDEDGRVWLELTFRDNLSVAVVSLMNSNGKEIYHIDAVEDTEPDENGYRNHTVTYDITDITGKLMIVLSDYALNESYYGLNTGGEGTAYGDLVAYQYNFYDESYGWVAFGEGVNEDEIQITLDEMDFVCAEYVGGFVFAQNSSGALYGFRYQDLLMDTFDIESTYITHLDHTYHDLAYSYIDGELYGLYAYDDGGYPTTELHTINIHGICYDEAGNVTRTAYEEVWAMSRGGLYGLCMAIDDAGTFYLLGTNEKGATELWTSYESSYGTLFKKTMGLDVELDYAQSMTWNHNNRTLYWAQFYPTSIYTYNTGLYTIDPAAGTYEQVGTLSGETCGMFAPLTPQTIASSEIYSNVPLMDTDLVGRPVLRKGVVNMNVGAQEMLFYDLDPWYTDHKAVVWSSSDETIVSVEQDGTITALAKGTAVITVRAVDDATLLSSCTVNVTELTLEIEGVVSKQESGVGNSSGSCLYKFVLEKGVASFIDGSPIVAGTELNFGLDIATSVYARGYIWACEYGNTGMIYQIDPATGEVVDSLMPVDGDMLFGMTYNEALDTFVGIMNMYLFVDLELSHEEEKQMLESYDEELNMFTYHRIDMLQYLIAAGGSFVTGEDGQGASSEIVMCGVTTLSDSVTYVGTGMDFLGNAQKGSVSYTSSQTLVVMDNVGRLWYIDEICGMSKSGSYYVDANGSRISANAYGVEVIDNGDGTYNVFYIRALEETPLTDMFRDGTMPRITYHFSDIEFGGYTDAGAPMFVMSLYDYWNNGNTNELYLYIPELYKDGQLVESEKLYFLGTTGQYNYIASIHSFKLISGLDD